MTAHGAGSAEPPAWAQEIMDRMKSLDRTVKDFKRDIVKELRAMTKNLDDLTAAVAAEGQVVQSAIVLISGIKSSLDAAIAAQADGDDAALPALSASLAEQAATLSAAVTANTPAAPPGDGSAS